MRWIFLTLFALALGIFLGRSSITSPLENSPEVVFARDMRAHHMQAVDMAVRIRDRITNDEEFTLLVTDMFLTQQNEVGQMQAWLNTWNLPLTGREPTMNGKGEQMGMAARADVSKLSTLPAKEAEKLFLQLMIRHHQGGAIMAKTILETNPREIVQVLANGIIRNQQIEIDAMRSYLKKRGGTELPAPTAMPMNHR